MVGSHGIATLDEIDVKSVDLEAFTSSPVRDFVAEVSVSAPYLKSAFARVFSIVMLLNIVLESVLLFCWSVILQCTLFGTDSDTLLLSAIRNSEATSCSRSTRKSKYGERTGIN